MLMTHAETTNHTENRLAVLRILESVVSPLTSHCFSIDDSADNGVEIIAKIIELFAFDLDSKVSGIC